MKYLKQFESRQYYSVEKEKITEFRELLNIQELKEKIETKLSKYLKIKTSDDFKKDSLHLFKSDNIETSDNIFLLDKDYGCRIISIMTINKGIYRDNPKYLVQIGSIKMNPTINKFKSGNLEGGFDSSKNISIEDFIEKFIDKLKKTNEIRLKNKETIKIKKLLRKYNL